MSRWIVALVGLFLTVTSVVALTSPGRIDIVDGQTRYEVARSLFEHGDSIIRDKAAFFAVYEGRNGDKYTDYRFPHSALGVVAIWLADVTGGADESRRQFFFSLIGSVVAGTLAVVYAVWFGQWYGCAKSLSFALAGIFCTPCWYYSTTTFDDGLGAFFVVLAVVLAWFSYTRQLLLCTAGAALAMALAVNCKPPLAVFGLVAVVACRRQWRPILVVCLGVVVGLLLGVMYHAYKFPSTDTFTEYSKMYGPWTTSNPLPGLLSLAVSPSCGVLWYCPTLLLSYWGWRSWTDRMFPWAFLSSSLLFIGFISFLPFFKGEPCWGPRYLTPVFALAWLFVACCLDRVGLLVVKCVLMCGLCVQLMAVSVDSLRLFVSTPIHWNYYNDYPWAGFDTRLSHLLQRPRELWEVCQRKGGRVFSPGPLATHAGSISAAQPAITGMVGVMGVCPLNGLSFEASLMLSWPQGMKHVSRYYEVFNAPRPWVCSQWALPETARPVDLCQTWTLLVAVGWIGLMLLGVTCHLFVEGQNEPESEPGRHDVARTVLGVAHGLDDYE